MADLQLRIRATNTTSRELQQLRREVDQLQKAAGPTNRSAQQPAQSVDQVDRSAKALYSLWTRCGW